jgi:hypothetical protein
MPRKNNKIKIATKIEKLGILIKTWNIEKTLK